MKALLILLAFILSLNSFSQFNTREISEDQILMSGSGALKLPSGIDGERPAIPQEGMIRLNTTSNSFEGYVNGIWDAIAGGGSPLTTDGDLLYYNSGDVRLAIGSEGQLLTVVGGFPAWQDAPVSTTLTTKGDIQTFDTANARLPVGSDGSFLVAASGETTGLKWSQSITGLISQAQFVGSVLFNDANCASVNSNKAVNTWHTINSDPDCVGESVGDITANDNMSINIQNVRTDGYYKVTYTGLLAASVTGQQRASLSSTNTYDNQGVANMDAGNYDGDSTLMGNFKFSTSGDKTIQIVHYPTATNGFTVYGQPNLSSKYAVYFFPDSNSLAAIQNKTANAKTANELSATILGSNGNVDSENYDFISGNCVNSSAGVYDCTYVSGVFTQHPSIVVTVHNSAVDRKCAVSNNDGNVTGFQVKCYDSANNPSNQNFDVHVSKQGADVNKSQVIAGTFENINSTDLVKVYGLSNSGQTITANTTPIPYIEIEDNTNSWDGDEFTAPRDSYYLIRGWRVYNSSNISDANFYVNGSFHTKAGKMETTTTNGELGGIIKLNQGDVLSIREDVTRTLLISNSHYLMITELPDTESIIKNLYADEATICETKYLSGNSTSVGNIGDLQFSTAQIGKKYSVNLHMFGASSSDAYITDGTEYILRYSNSTSGGIVTSQVNHCYVATTSTFNVYQSNTSTIYGNGSPLQTFVQYCKLPDSTICN